MRSGNFSTTSGLHKNFGLQLTACYRALFIASLPLLTLLLLLPLPLPLAPYSSRSASDVPPPPWQTIVSHQITRSITFPHSPIHPFRSPAYTHFIHLNLSIELISYIYPPRPRPRCGARRTHPPGEGSSASLLSHANPFLLLPRVLSLLSCVYHNSLQLPHLPHTLIHPFKSALSRS